jgi:hypothetical protein
MDERRRVLEMVAEGKISVDQGATLLDALGEDGPPAGEKAGNDLGSELLGAITRAIDADTTRLIRGKKIKHKPPGRSVDQILSFASQGVSPEYVRAIRDLFDEVSADDIVSLSSMGVRADYVREIRNLFDDIDADDFIAMSSMGVNAAYVRDMQDLLDDVSPGDIVGLFSMGVTAEYIRDLQDVGIDASTVEDVLKRRATHTPAEPPDA